MPILIDLPTSDEPLGPVCGIGYGSSYTHLCLRGNIPIRFNGVGYGNSTPHHRLHGDICTDIVLCGEGVAHSHGNVTIKRNVPLWLSLRGEGEMNSKGAPCTMVSSIADYALSFSACADITTLTPVRVYCNDLSPLVPTLGNHLPEVEGYQGACPTTCYDGMPGDGTRYYPTNPCSAPPLSIWQSLQGVEMRILQEAPITSSPYGYHQIWLLADLWYKGQQVMYLRNGTGAQAPSRHILNRGAFNNLVVYLTKALGMNHNVYAYPVPDSTRINKDISMVKQWGLNYTHRNY